MTLKPNICVTNSIIASITVSFGRGKYIYFFFWYVCVKFHQFEASVSSRFFFFLANLKPVLSIDTDNRHVCYHAEKISPLIKSMIYMGYVWLLRARKTVTEH